MTSRLAGSSNNRATNPRSTSGHLVPNPFRAQVVAPRATQNRQLNAFIESFSRRLQQIRDIPEDEAKAHAKRLAMKTQRKAIVKVSVNVEWARSLGSKGIRDKFQLAGEPLSLVQAVQIPLLQNDHMLLIVKTREHARQIRENEGLLREALHGEKTHAHIQPENFCIVPSAVTKSEIERKMRIHGGIRGATLNYREMFANPMQSLDGWKQETGLDIKKAYWKYGYLWFILEDLDQAKQAVSGGVYTLHGMQTRFITADCPKSMDPQCFKCDGPHPSYFLRSCNHPAIVNMLETCKLYRGPAPWSIVASGPRWTDAYDDGLSDTDSFIEDFLLEQMLSGMDHGNPSQPFSEADGLPTHSHGEPVSRSTSPSPSTCSSSSRLSEIIEESPNRLNKRASGMVLLAAIGQTPHDTTESGASSDAQSSQDVDIDSSFNVVADTPVQSDQLSDSDSESGSDLTLTPTSSMGSVSGLSGSFTFRQAKLPSRDSSSLVPSKRSMAEVGLVSGGNEVKRPHLDPWRPSQVAKAQFEDWTGHFLPTNIGASGLSPKNHRQRKSPTQNKPSRESIPPPKIGFRPTLPSRASSETGASSPSSMCTPAAPRTLSHGPASIMMDGDGHGVGKSSSRPSPAKSPSPEPRGGLQPRSTSKPAKVGLPQKPRQSASQSRLSRQGGGHLNSLAEDDVSDVARDCITCMPMPDKTPKQRRSGQTDMYSFFTPV
ncbi:hypothetical protein FSARC_13331 [Fusarium sarcochroum]|uniref:Uncharacterized protein n=1 Tax=Fusarium sarcochroum TaxID=1208366 RepID=A0A8H4WU08_9HYPO|nr:hypothetical protein FSARC_13331 [Fusarium sarcochroum]